MLSVARQITEPGPRGRDDAGLDLPRVRPLVTLGLYLLADFMSLSVATNVSLLVTGHFEGYDPALFLPVVVFFMAAFCLRDLYPGTGMTPPEELRRVTYASLLAALSLQILSLGAFNPPFSRDGILVSLGMAILTVPLMRAVVRCLFSHQDWWGTPAIVWGAGKTGSMVIRALRLQPGFGIRPLAILDDHVSSCAEVEGVPVLGGLHHTPELLKKCKIPYLIVAMPGVSSRSIAPLIEQYATTARNVLVIPDLLGVSSLWVTARDVGGVVGLEIRHKLLRPEVQLFKRCADLLCCALLFILALPLMLLTWLAIKLESPGPAIFVQPRLGKDGRLFNLLKFRSMYCDAEERLQQVLTSDPKLADEYESYCKLKKDPRVTRIGAFIRKFSIDELPQLWNVLKGEISLVGPRAYLPSERPKMRGKEGTVLRVLPGVTGLWQVSGRNQITFNDRVDMDVYYVRNWSPWFDLYLLARTVWVVLFQRGAAY